MGRILFAAVLGFIALLYLWLAYVSLFDEQGFMRENQIIGVVVFLIMGGAAAFGSINLLKEKSNH
jgi:hypothetical protein